MNQENDKGEYPKLTGKKLREIANQLRPEEDRSVQILYVYIDGDTQGDKFIYLN